MFEANKLLKDIKSKKDKWNERSQFKIKGVGNLSMSDLDTLELYAETYINFGDLNSLMRPLGDILEVLKAYGY
jgi:hypothetical protein